EPGGASRSEFCAVRMRRVRMLRRITARRGSGGAAASKSVIASRRNMVESRGKLKHALPNFHREHGLVVEGGGGEFVQVVEDRGHQLRGGLAQLRAGYLRQAAA